MTERRTDERVAYLEQEMAVLKQQLAQIREYLTKQVDLNRKLATALAKSARTATATEESQRKLVRQQDLFLTIVSAKLFADPAELRTLLQAISANPETPEELVQAAAELSDALVPAASDRDRPRWIPEIVAGTDVDKS